MNNNEKCLMNIILNYRILELKNKIPLEYHDIISKIMYLEKYQTNLNTISDIQFLDIYQKHIEISFID